jgi:hypothetical protein
MSNRTLKAYTCRVRGSDAEQADIIFAATASQAKAKLAGILLDCHYERRDAFRLTSARRAPDHDIVLPKPHWLVADLSDEERHIVLHAYGYCFTKRPQDWGNRDHYCTSPCDGRLHRLTWELGLFTGPHGAEDGYGEVRGWVGAFYYLTELGTHVARSMIPA